MTSHKIGILAVFFGATVAVLSAQSSAVRTSAPAKSRASVPAAFKAFRIPPSAPLRFLASEEGRAFLKATGHPLAQAAIAAFGEPAKDTVVPAQWYQQAEQQAEAAAAPAVLCTGNTGARFNLEPRVNAVPQNQASADFIPNRISANNDLIVQAANDWRGNLTSGVQWDQNVSGYYVHRSTTSDCSAQFEGGLPTFTAQGNQEFGIGMTVVAADPARDVFFMADARFASTGGVGLFRAAASTLLNATACPNGSHSQAKAASCWTATPPVLLFPVGAAGAVGDMPSISVDERASGTGASDVYVAEVNFNTTSGTAAVFLAACTTTLNCGAGTGVALSGSDQSVAYPYVRVRPDGLINVSYVNANTDGSLDIKFVSCTPAGAPKNPVCGPPVLARHVVQPLVPGFDISTPITNIELLAATFPKHASRAEAGGKFTTFLVYDDCKKPFTQGNPAFTICLGAEVAIATSTDGGKTWSAPVSVDSSTGHHFYPAITSDASTGIVNIAYYSTEGDRFNHEVRVFRNQINPGGVAAGTPLAVTKTSDPIDANPQNLGFFQSDAFMGAVARGTGVSGQSRLYVSFDATTVPGTYNGQPLPEQNNHITAISY